MDGYIAKPIQDQELIKAISALLPSLNSSRTTTDNLPSGLTPCFDVTAVAASPQLTAPRIDWDLALNSVGGNEHVLHSFVAVFRQDVSALLDETKQALAQKDGPKLHRTAHTIKGMISFFGANQLADLALTLEQLGENNEFANAHATFESLTCGLHLLQNELNAR